MSQLKLKMTGSASVALKCGNCDALQLEGQDFSLEAKSDLRCQDLVIQGQDLHEVSSRPRSGLEDNKTAY